MKLLKFNIYFLSLVFSGLALLGCDVLNSSEVGVDKKNNAIYIWSPSLKSDALVDFGAEPWELDGIFWSYNGKPYSGLINLNEEVAPENYKTYVHYVTYEDSFFEVVNGRFSRYINDVDSNKADFKILGTIEGVQGRYFMKNKNGRDMIIMGKKVPVPSSDYRFFFEENKKVSLIQKSENERVYYNGTYTLQNDNNGIINIVCSLSDGGYSNPRMIIEFNKSTGKYIFRGDLRNEPNFDLNIVE